MNLRSEGGIKALLGIVRCGHPDVLSQVARGIANFAKCESRACTQGKNLCPKHVISPAPVPSNVFNYCCSLSAICGQNWNLMPNEPSDHLCWPTIGFEFPLDEVSTFSCLISICWPSIGIKSGRSILIEDGALPWIVQNANDEAAPIRRHIELALCHLAQHGRCICHILCKILNILYVPLTYWVF